MSVEHRWAAAVDAIVAAWLRHLEAHRLLMAPAPALAAQLSGWVEQLDPGADDHQELLEQVALHARDLGADGKPASAALTQIALLEDALIDARIDIEPLRDRLRELARVVADAHALGAASRLERRFRRTLSGAPVVQLPGQAVVAFMVGPMDADVIDALVGRLLRAAAGLGAPRIVLDVSSAEPDDEVFHRSLEGFAKGRDFQSFSLAVTGLRDAAATRRRLDARGVPAGRIALFDRLEAALEGASGA